MLPLLLGKNLLLAGQLLNNQESTQAKNLV
jgi:hypothetical protein